jgi:hypothetical protein
MEATDTRYIIAPGLGSPRLRTRYDETKHQWNLGIEDLSMKTHVVGVINIWRLNLKKERKAY